MEIKRAGRGRHLLGGLRDVLDNSRGLACSATAQSRATRCLAPAAARGHGTPKRTRPWRAVDQRHVRCGERQVYRRALRKGPPQNTRARLTRKATSILTECPIFLSGAPPRPRGARQGVKRQRLGAWETRGSLREAL